MKVITTCPCCSSPMLHHFRDRQEYWFCRQCWQEMPDLLEVRRKSNFSQHQIVNLSASLKTLNSQPHLEEVALSLR